MGGRYSRSWVFGRRKDEKWISFFLFFYARPWRYRHRRRRQRASMSPRRTFLRGTRQSEHHRSQYNIMILYRYITATPAVVMRYHTINNYYNYYEFLIVVADA